MISDNYRRRKIKFDKNEYTLINLTEPLRNNIKVFPGDPKPKKRNICTYKKSNCLYNEYSIGDHIFHPHGDAPSHHNPEYKNIGFEFWDLNFVFNNTCMIDISEVKEAKVINGIKFISKITFEHLDKYKNCIKKNTALIIRTGYDKYLEKNKSHTKKNIPYIDNNAADFLYSFTNIKVIGTDSLTVDKPGNNYVHRLFKHKFIIESLVNLYSIPKKKRDSFILQTSPVAIVGATGGPVIAYAYV